MARKPPKGKSLAELNPELAKQWHPTKNRDLTPFDVSCGSDKKVWWKCEKGKDHEWDSSIFSRVSGTNCPMCSGRRVTKLTSLSNNNPDIAEMWHPTKNGDLTPSKITSKSGKKVWWKCANNHVFKESVLNVQRRKEKCMLCISLYEVRPDLSEEWHPTKNGELTPLDVSYSSGRKVWWKCEKEDDHEWQQTIDSRNKSRGCSVCSGKKVVMSNCLETTHPQLAREWHQLKNGNLTPLKVIAGSHKHVWWKCDKGSDHEWKSRLSSRLDGNGCPICAGKKVVNSNCLAITQPELAKEWHPKKNNKLTPFHITSGSGKEVWWKCKASHIWRADVANRTTGTGCPKCAEHGFNPEKEAFFYIRKVNILNVKESLKYGVTNQLDGKREKKQRSKEEI